jgi:hypothetical protein
VTPNKESIYLSESPISKKLERARDELLDLSARNRLLNMPRQSRAALEVVKRRLDKAGVGDACLELHSNKANKKALLAELRRTWELGVPRGVSSDLADSGLERARHVLNGHAFRMHATLPSNGLSPYEVIGQLARIQRLHGAGSGVRVEGADKWNPEDRQERFRIVREIARWIESEGTPSGHTWWCVGLESILPIEAQRISRTAVELSASLTETAGLQAQLASELGIGIPEKLQDFADVATRAQRISTAPPSVGLALGSPEWERAEEVRSLVEVGSRFKTLSSELRRHISSKGWHASTDAARAVLGSLPGRLDTQWLAQAERLDRLIPQAARRRERGAE